LRSSIGIVSLVLAVVTAVNNANVGSDGSAQALLDGFHPALVVSVVAAVLGVAAVGLGRRARPEIAVEVVPESEPQPEVEAA
jgi:hypothetical protein